MRRAHPRGELVRRRGAFALGREALQLTRKTGYEAWNYFTYWFDRSGTLSAIQTGSGGC